MNHAFMHPRFNLTHAGKRPNLGTKKAPATHARASTALSAALPCTSTVYVLCLQSDGQVTAWAVVVAFDLLIPLGMQAL